jgi:hypothetical protein
VKVGVGKVEHRQLKGLGNMGLTVLVVEEIGDGDCLAKMRGHEGFRDFVFPCAASVRIGQIMSELTFGRPTDPGHLVRVVDD